MGRWLVCVIVIASAVGCGSPSRASTDASEQTVPDAPKQSGEFGDGCSKHTDCSAGYCVEPVGNIGGVCTRECNAGCPDGWECRTVDLPQVDLELCIPAAPQLCLACSSDAECGGGACIQLDGGGRCVTPCTDQCATGYTCAPDASGVHAGNFCQPVTGSCTCSAALTGAMRSCSTANAIGTCFGTQTCDAATGWSACTARTAAGEVCNGTDDDCNFIIDDGLSGGGVACTIANGFGSCPGVSACNGSSGFVCLGKTPGAETCNFSDDDCDSVVDEGFPGLGSACTAGVGTCTRYGSQRCNGSGTGLVCSATAAPPGTEACNQFDDDCDSSTDENFKLPTAPLATAIGSVCSAGFGVCARYGTNVCRADGTGTQCSAVADPNSMTTESCNYLDDNCDGTVDNGFRDVTTGVYTNDQHCGSCGTNCATIYAGANAFGACQAGATSAVCVMRCNAGSGNLNGSTVDGCEFTLDATAIYVSTTDATALDDATCGMGPTGTGAGNHPCKTITQGLARASATGRSQVLVADGTYAEGVTLVNGKQLLGGYRADTWERHLSTTSTVISGFTAAGNHDRTIVASGITSTTVFEGFVVRGSFNTKPSGNSYALYVTGSSASLVIRNNQIFGGRGGAGQQGMSGVPGAQGVNGAGATGPNDANYIARAVSGCSGTPVASLVRQYTNGGVRTCGASNVSGGNGGGNWCPPSPNAGLPGNQSSELSGKDGLNGSTGGGGAGGVGADAGDDGFIYQDGNRCVIPSNGAFTFGLDGTSGATGSSASPATGCSSGAGTISGGHWVGGGGVTGGTGTSGGGGGGGGAGGGAYCNDCSMGAPVGGNHRVGGHGGGGGSGGCGGAGGSGGGGGGGAFGIFVVGGSAPTLQNNAITRGDGGIGGNGGIGGAGGLGGQGGAGGQSDQFCTDKAGRGGDGGAAGHGAGGGGGCGGSSYGIFTSGVGTPAYCANNTVIGGAPGGGGAGGFSGGNSGGAGGMGVLQDCVSL